MVMLAGAWALIAWAMAVMAVGVHRRVRSGPAAVPRTGWTAMPVAAAAAVLVVVVGSSFDRPALGLLLAGPVFCLVLAATAVLGELVVRPATGARRRATVTARSALDYVERPQLVAVGAVFALAAAFLATAARFGHADDRGRPGRWLDLPSPIYGQGGWTILWPGAYYAVPLLAALGLAALTIGAALRRIAARPRPDVDAAAPDPVAADEEARRRAAEVVLAAGGVAAAAALCGAGLVAASGLSGAGALWPVLGILLWVVVVAAAAVGAWSAAVLVTPGRARRTAVRM